MRKVSLDEIAVATKIGTRSLKALEDENFSILPGGIFNKGFVRAYAKFLGINEEEAVADYQAAVNEQPISVKTIAAQSAIAKANRLAAQQKQESSEQAALIRTLVLLIVAIAVLYGGYKAYKHGLFHAFKMPSMHRQLKQQAEAKPAPASPAPTLPAAAPLPAPSTTTQPEAVPNEFTVSIKTSAESWLSVVADGKRAVQRTFAPNEQQEITAKNRVRIVIGNPGGTELSLNGKPLPLSGDLNRPRTVVIGANGFADE